MSEHKCKVLIMAAGTGGHIIPALAVAQALQQQGAQVRWLGTEHGLEQRLVPPTGIALEKITMRGVRNKGVSGLLVAPWRLLKAVWQSRKIIQDYQPSVIIGFGGYIAAPGGLAAFLCAKPLLIHEQNAAAGLTNRCLAPLARQVYQAFPAAFSPRYRPITCGNPVRIEIAAISDPVQRLGQRTGPLNLLIIGGSQGAQWFNQNLPKALAAMTTRPFIRHAAGPGRAAEVENNYCQAGIDAEVVEFINDMAESYAWADLVLCRSGALTVSELAAAGVASILVPYPHAVDDHQTKNGQWLENAGAAILIQQNALEESSLTELLSSLQAQRSKLQAMAIAARQLAPQEATTCLVNACLAFPG